MKGEKKETKEIIRLAMKELPLTLIVRCIKHSVK